MTIIQATGTSLVLKAMVARTLLDMSGCPSNEELAKSVKFVTYGLGISCVGSTDK